MMHSADATRSTPESTTGAAAPSAPGRHVKDFISDDALTALIQNAREEDLGPSGRDVTSAVLRQPDQTVHAEIRVLAPGTLCGTALLPDVCTAYGATVEVVPARTDGQILCADDVVARLTGPLAALLTLERVALNFITWLSGIATLTSQHVAAVAGTKAAICDTRKTHPGLRRLEKYAVACGGGSTHRMGLYDAALLKDNHIADVPIDQLADAVEAMTRQLRAMQPPPRFVAVEVDSIEQLACVLNCPVDIVLLDNMSIPTMRKAVQLRDARSRAIQLEASGGITMANVGQVAATGVDRISIGALTHSARALDFTMAVTGPAVTPNADTAS